MEKEDYRPLVFTAVFVIGFHLSFMLLEVIFK